MRQWFVLNRFPCIKPSYSRPLPEKLELLYRLEIHLYFFCHEEKRLKEFRHF